MGPDDWKTGRDQTQHLNIYTDGSKMEGIVGAGLYCTDPEIKLSYKLPSDCSIFQAEIFAIRKSAGGSKYKPTKVLKLECILPTNGKPVSR